MLGSCYDYMGSSCTVQPYDEQAVSLPTALRSPVELSTVLKPETWDHLSLDNMLADDDMVAWRRSAGKTIPYLDERLRKDSRLYFDFIGRLFDAGIAGVTDTCRETVAPFFVAKKGG